jgi:hypothetical protein
MAAGDYESALPVALEAVTIGEKLFKPQPALQLFPLYLLAAQVCQAVLCCHVHDAHQANNATILVSQQQ